MRCIRCRKLGHKARECRAATPLHRPQRSSPSPTPQSPPPLDLVTFPELPRRGMAQPGDPAQRPGDTSAVAVVTSGMEAELVRLSSCAVVACLSKDRDDVAPERVKKALCGHISVRSEDIKISRIDLRTS